MAPLPHYIRRKLFGPVSNVVLLALAPAFWGLLALNNILINPELPGSPLATNSLSVCLYRYAACVVLALALTGLMLLYCQVSPLAFGRATVRFLRHNMPSFLMVAILGHVFALPFFFRSFDVIGIVLTNLIGLGLIPLVAAFMGLLSRAPVFQKAPAWLRWDMPSANIFNISSLVLVVVGLFAYALLAFDTINIPAWTGREVDAGSFGEGLLWSFLFAFAWASTLKATSMWPSKATSRVEDQVARTFTLAQHYAVIQHAGEGAGKERLMKQQDGLDIAEVLFVRLGLVQALALAIWLIGSLGFASAWPDSSLGQTSSAILSDIIHLIPRLAESSGLRVVALLIILLIPSFAAYYLLNFATRRYDETAARQGTAVTSSDWNGLLAFLEPICATAIGILLLEWMDSRYLGHFFAQPGGVGEAHLFAYPLTLLWFVPLIYGGVFALKFAAIFVAVRRRDVDAYFQRLQKVFEAVLCTSPRATTLSPEEAVPLGLKEQDRGAIQLSLQTDGALMERFFNYKRNLVERARIHLEFQAESAFYPDYPTIPSQRSSSVEMGAPVLAGRLLPLREGPLYGNAVTLACQNFGGRPETRIAADFDLHLLRFPRYGQLLPYDSYVWREIERGIHLYLTGGLWFKLKRQVHWTLGATCFTDTEARAWDAFQRVTRGFLQIRAGRSFRHVLTELLHIGEDVLWEGLALRAPMEMGVKSWREIIFPIVPHILDTDTMAMGYKESLFSATQSDDRTSRNQWSPEDKLLILMTPKSPSMLEPLFFRNPVWHDGSNLGQEFPVNVYNEFARLINEISGKEQRKTWRQTVYANGFVLLNRD